MSAAAGQKLSRDDWRKRKELEEARKAGTAPAEVDEEGRDINPHIPQYISQAPWYVSLGRPSLKHQRPQEEKQKKYSAFNEWYKRGVIEGKTTTKFRKGACENCGSMTHKKKDCMERPRKVGAKFTGKAIMPDEHIQPQLSFSYDAKRDRWNGYNLNEHATIIEEHAKVEMAKRKLKAEKLQEELLSGKLPEGSVKDTVDSDDSDADEDKYADQADMPGTKFDSKTRTTVRNLRIREDTAKYLYNLDPNSAFYDPKTRSMRENPFKNTNKDPSELKFGGDNFVRQSGDVKHFARAQMFAWETYEHGTDIHPLADPTKLELMHKDFHVKKGDFKDEQQQSVLDKYGGEEHLNAPPKELLLAQTEHYVEYSRLGNVIKGQERAVAKSKYEEDIHVNNHSSVWGSYWEEGKWGYACCHSLLKGSYCTGEAGKLARKSSQQTSFMPRTEGLGVAEEKEEEEEEGRGQSLLEQHRTKQSKQAKSKREHREERRRREEAEAIEKEERLKKAIEEEEEREKEVDHIMALDERKRPYQSMRAEQSREPTEEEMEAYYLKKKRKEDPMAQFV